MIKRDEVFLIGHFYKTHGVGGELAFSFTSDVFEQGESPYWVIDMDGILVPFFPTSCRMRSSSSALVCLDGIDSEVKARDMVGREVFYPSRFKPEFDEEDDDYRVLIGLDVIDRNAGLLGQVVDVDDSTINILLVISDGSNELLVPLAGDFITGIDGKKHCINVTLPDELIHLQS